MSNNALANWRLSPTVMTKLFLGIVAFSAAQLCVMPSVAQGQPVQVEVLNLRDKVVDAEFTTFDSTGCIETHAFVVASTASVIATSPPTTQPLLALSYDVFDNCNTIILRSGFGSTNVIDFSLDGGLTTAHAGATVVVSDDQHGTVFNMYVSLDWAGVGNIRKQQVNEHIVTPGFIFEIASTGSFRDATAAGTVTDGITNFTPPVWRRAS